jgi:hypothetical protein
MLVMDNSYKITRELNISKGEKKYE